mmetsp:Transcript_111967/g.289340  ORF Transcript_111967/g.289340 Transcript_111967/m.289340 type:complete len:649 (+) Transcript_111967:71-2017(+)
MSAIQVLPKLLGQDWSCWTCDSKPAAGVATPAADEATTGCTINSVESRTEHDDSGSNLDKAIPPCHCLTSASIEDSLDEDSVQNVISEADQRMLRVERRRWTLQREAAEQTSRKQELLELIRQTSIEHQGPPLFREAQGPANRFGSTARFPPFDKSKHVPVLALINRGSGAMAGADILAVAQKMPYYQDRFFNIIDVVRDRRRGGLMDVFRQQLNAAREEAKARGLRPRLISGGGDGTASFALYVIFAALSADPERADEGLADAGNGFIWSDEELSDFFPAIAQMPLGTANDFGANLGWGRKYPGAAALGHIQTSKRASLAEQALQQWISAVISPESHVVGFDVWGFMPAPGAEACDFKLCELGGERGWNPKVSAEGQQHLVMKTAALPVPLFACLYFSAGFSGYLVSRFQINRRRTPISNVMEYARHVAGILTETQPAELNKWLEGVTVSCAGTEYFPPRSSEGNEASRYWEVGFCNTNGKYVSGADRTPAVARVCSTREPAKFNDAKMDMYRMKPISPLKNLGLKKQTDKTEGPMTLTFSGGKGKGLFFQWDGEARFAFSPSGEAFNIHIKKILNIPVVLGPEFDVKVTGHPKSGADCNFAFCGEAAQEKEAARSRVLRCVRQELNTELNASREEILAAGFLCQEG